MPNQKRNEKVRYAVSKALKQRGLTHKDVAKILGLAEQTVGNRISNGDFNESKAAQWSAALGIEQEVFLHGKEPLPPNNYQAIVETIMNMRKEIEDLRRDMDMLLARKEDSI